MEGIFISSRARNKCRMMANYSVNVTHSDMAVLLLLVFPLCKSKYPVFFFESMILLMF